MPNTIRYLLGGLLIVAGLGGAAWVVYIWPTLNTPPVATTAPTVSPTTPEIVRPPAPKPRKRPPPAETPEKAVALFLAAAKSGDLETIVDLHPEDWVEPLQRLIAARRGLYAAHLKVLRALWGRFDAPTVAGFQSKHFLRGSIIDQEVDRLRQIDGMTVRSTFVQERSGGEPSRVSLFVDIVVGENTFRNKWEFIALKESDGWRLARAVAFLAADPERPLGQSARHLANLYEGDSESLETVAIEVKAGKYKGIEEIAAIYDKLFNRIAYAQYDVFPLLGWNACDTPPGGEYWPKK